MRSRLLACLAFALIAARAEATVVRFTFTGTIDQISGPVTSPIMIGHPFTVSYTFDTEAPDVNPFPNIGEYPSALIEVEGQIGPVPIGYTLGGIEIRNDTALGDVYSALSGAATSEVEFFLADFGSLAFRDDSLPPTLDLTQFDSTRFVLRRFLSATETSEVSGPITGFSSALACYADCNEDTQLTVPDFSCFQSRFVAADPYADCDSNGGLTIADFGCFQTAFVGGCP